jgi:hypothetical protein
VPRDVEEDKEDDAWQWLSSNDEEVQVDTSDPQLVDTSDPQLCCDSN